MTRARDERAFRLWRERERSTVRPPDDAPVAMTYPSPYRVGMSSLGFQTLYRALNEEGPGAHRVFLPDEWEKQTLAWPAPRRAVLSLEGERPVSAYPIVALSVAYELELTGVVRLLEGSGIPLYAHQRGPKDPIVVAGGPLTNSNPSSLLPFVDLLICGEAELSFPTAVERLLAEPSRRAALESAAELEGVVVGEIDEGRFEPIPAMGIAPRDTLPARSAIVTPDAELSDMFLIEPERGCSRRCTFCVMRGETTGGMRIVEPGRVQELIPEHAKRVGLVGAAVTDLPHLEELVAAIVETGRGVGISSLRADRLTPGFLKSLAAGGYQTITVASDGISARMREVLQRGIDEEALLRAAKLVKAHGFRGMKLYQMIGAPSETDEDADELVRFVSELADIVPMTLTISTFVSKRNTPLDGREFVGVKAAERRLQRIRKGLGGRVKLRPQPPKWAHVEWLLAQRGPEAGRAAVEAVHAGANYAAWTRAFEALPPNERAPVFGNEERVARRRGFAARKHLPLV